MPEGLLARLFGAKESLAALSVALGSLVPPLAIELLGIRGALAVLGLVAPALAAGAVDFGANGGDRRVLIRLETLFRNGSPASIPVPD